MEIAMFCLVCFFIVDRIITTVSICKLKRKIDIPQYSSAYISLKDRIVYLEKEFLKHTKHL